MPRAHQLGRYQLLDRIAFGGMAEIYRAKTFDQRGQAHLVAVKRVLAHLTDDEDFLKMLVDEAKVTAMLKHANIARLYEFVQASDEYFLAMEWVDGKDVRALLELHRKSRTHLPPEHVAWVIMEAAAGLHAAHTQKDADGKALQIVHRDVSPSNLLCAYSGEVKLCDFGIAKATTSRVQTKTGVIKGKVKYMSPEQALGRKLDARSDLFSLGSVAYEMLTLRAPFFAKTEVELIFAVRDAKRPPIHELCDVPPELERIVDEMMARSRSQRFANCGDVAAALRAFLDEYRPGYRRSHFSRFMRKTFAEEIERELRALEEYVLEEDANLKEVGTNLIADAMGGDAPYAQFFPSATMREKARKRLNPGSGKNRPNLHADSTRIFDARELEEKRATRAIVGTGGAGRGSSPPEQSTRLFGRDLGGSIKSNVSKGGTAPTVHEERTRLFGKDDPMPSRTGSHRRAARSGEVLDEAEVALDESDILAEDTIDHGSGFGGSGSYRKRR